MIEFDLTGPLPTGTTVLEASAGTGKTHAIATLAARYVAEGVARMDQLMIVTFSREASRELRSRVRERFVELADDSQDGTSETASWTEDERARLHQGLRDFDRATIMTIHEFCSVMFAGLGVLAGSSPDGDLVEDLEPLLREVAHDLYLARYADAPSVPFPYADQERDRLVTESGALTLARDALFDPDGELVPSGAPGAVGERIAFGLAVRQEAAARRHRTGVLTFDDQVARLRDALADPSQGEAACARLRARFTVVLVDEFQDTDPVQWEILRRAFHGLTPLVLIGDPKQAIYGFRGADVRSYLTASQVADARTTLSVNHRADAPLVAALDHLLLGLEFGAGIAVHPVTAERPDSRLQGPDGLPAVPLRLRTLVDQPRVADSRQRITDDLVDQVQQLLSSGFTYRGAQGLRPVQASDLGVLVRTNEGGRRIARALRAAGIPVAFSGSDSLFTSRAAKAWAAVLAAMANPRPAAVRAAMLTPFFGRSLDDLARADEDTLGDWTAILRRWERLLARHGVAALLAAITGETDFTTRVLANRGGDRLMTDVRHLAQLLAQATGSEQPTAARLAEWLAEEMESSVGSSERTRRLETDAQAVQIKTIHKAKGLQFPIVLLPDLTDLYLNEPDDRRLVLHDSAGHRVVDLGGRSGPGRVQRVLAARHEAAEDSLRTLYVALTRAHSQVIAWWSRTPRNTAASPLHRVLFRDRQQAKPDLEYPVDSAPGDGDPAELAWLVGAPGIGVERVGLRPERVGKAPDQPTVALTARRFERSIDPHWRRTSYSGLTAAVHGEGGWFEVPETVGLTDDEAADAPADEASTPLTPMASLPGGAAFGSLVHALFEEVDTQLTATRGVDDLSKDLIAAATGLLPQFPLPGLDPTTLAEAVLPSILTPLGPLASNQRLADLASTDRLSELSFEMPTADRGGITLGQVADLLEAHLPSDDPLRAYPATLRDPALGDAPLRGFLTGSIDAVLRIGGGDEPRYLVVDYKTNRLPEPDGYDQAGLAQAMIDSHYPLQALLYCVALHRFLSGRLAGYQPGAQLAGVLYLFVRGMGPGTTRGIFSWAPPVSLITELSRLLAGEVADADA